MKRGLFLKIIRMVLFSYAILLLIFSILSGAEPGLKGLFINLPNAIPWVILLVIHWLAGKNERNGGIMLMLYSAVLAYLFNVRIAFSFSFLALILPVFIFGLLFFGHAPGKRGSL